MEYQQTDLQTADETTLVVNFNAEDRLLLEMMASNIAQILERHQLELDYHSMLSVSPEFQTRQTRLVNLSIQQDPDEILIQKRRENESQRNAVAEQLAMYTTRLLRQHTVNSWPILEMNGARGRLGGQEERQELLDSWSFDTFAYSPVC